MWMNKYDEEVVCESAGAELCDAYLCECSPSALSIAYSEVKLVTEIAMLKISRSKGVILNISSAAGMYPTPLLTLYSATKAFVDYFSRGLHAEYKSKGIIVQSVLPYYVATKMSKIRKPTFDKPSPEKYVRAALGTVGLQSQTNGCLPHALMGWVFSLLPTPTVINFLMKTNKQIRARYLKKMKEK
ncbi:very-long-chain 3-oxoacyl-CoA reductase [Antrostomus carolinensis]|uniref:very-long-chain 3-oxoacyl-CoA reductase n=1 Tax=Antrostomus carolinensis TaxID=279965 RepID=UPI0010A97D72|nr:very-long-chain 3-oxoacyl-CoA reductase [Antrostomus carolinensis]